MAPACGAFSVATRVRRCPTAGEVRPPRVVFFRSGVCETASEKSGSGGSTLLDGGYCCSSTTTSGPAWRWPAWCRAVCFLALPYRLGLRLATTSRVGEGGLPHRLSLVRPVQPSGVVLIVLMAQSNQSGPLEVVFEFFLC